MIIITESTTITQEFLNQTGPYYIRANNINLTFKNNLIIKDKNNYFIVESEYENINFFGLNIEIQVSNLEQLITVSGLNVLISGFILKWSGSPNVTFLGLVNNDGKSTTIENCTVYGSFSNETGQNSGICKNTSNVRIQYCNFYGNLYNNSTGICNNFSFTTDINIYNCNFEGNIFYNSAGISINYGNLSICNCNSEGELIESSGICLNFSNLIQIFNCNFKGKIFSYSSGILINKSSVDFLDRCSCNAEIYSYSSGIINNTGLFVKITRCFSIGNLIEGPCSGIYFGNVNTELSDCYSSCNIKSDNVSGIIYCESDCKLQNCYFDGPFFNNVSAALVYLKYGTYTGHNLYVIPNVPSYIGDSQYVKESNIYLLKGEEWSDTTANSILIGALNYSDSIWVGGENNTPYKLAKFYKIVDININLNQEICNYNLWPLELLNRTKTINVFLTVSEDLNITLTSEAILPKSTFVIFDGNNKKINLTVENYTNYFCFINNQNYNDVTIQNVILIYITQIPNTVNYFSGLVFNRGGDRLNIKFCDVSINFQEGEIYRYNSGYCNNEGSVYFNNCIFRGNLYGHSAGFSQNHGFVQCLECKAYINKINKSSMGYVFNNDLKTAEILYCYLECGTIENDSYGLARNHVSTSQMLISYCEIAISIVRNNSAGIVYNSSDTFVMDNCFGTIGLVTDRSSGVCINTKNRRADLISMNLTISEISKDSAGIIINYGPVSKLTNCTVTGNVLNKSGGLAHNNDRLDIINCTCYCDVDNFSGGLVYNVNGFVSMTGSSNYPNFVKNNSAGICYNNDRFEATDLFFGDLSKTIVEENSAGICINNLNLQLRNATSKCKSIYNNSSGILITSHSLEIFDTLTTYSDYIDNNSAGICYNIDGVTKIRSCITYGNLINNSAGIFYNIGGPEPIEIEECRYDGIVYGDYNGCIVKNQNDCKIIIQKCFVSAGEIKGKYNGGIYQNYFFNPDEDHKVIIKNCYNLANITGQFCGGLLCAYIQTAEISDSYVSGIISNTNNANYCVFYSTENNSFKLYLINLYCLFALVNDYINLTQYTLNPSISYIYNVSENGWSDYTANNTLYTSSGVWYSIEAETPYVLSAFVSENTYQSVDNVNSTETQTIIPEEGQS